MFPAPAGINRFPTESASVASGVPRASGDKSSQTHCFIAPRWCSPRQRG
ncbi:hypothetical protein HMPREF1616_00609 [Escherichia coli 908658]|nr:hypothetical protein HMPREF1616_00609 [Escherichia coli 908658]